MTDKKRVAGNKRNAAEATEQIPPAFTAIPVSLEKVLLALAEGMNRLEKVVLHSGYGSYPQRDDAPPRITEVPQGVLGNKASSQSAPVSVLIDDVHSRTSGLRSRLESLRDSLVHGIHPDSPERGNSVAMAGTPSQGPSKDALNYSFGNLVAAESVVEEIERYLLNR